MRTILLAAALLAGCTSNRSLDATSPGAAAEINAQGQRQAALLALASGETTTARHLHVAPDVTTWLDAATGDLRSAPTAEVARIQFRHHGRGALEGAGVGVLLAAVAAGITLVTYPSNDWFTPPAAAFVVGVVTGVPTTALTASVGAAVGARNVYTPPDQP
ncbi:hypothetical protein [Rubrivirga sp. IMCC45206]|uniref:hypothetical protein n=1 Tax=Rubrivirga sp. IMCC45206 TaxID=3391614 RepID=UPI00398FB0F5